MEKKGKVTSISSLIPADEAQKASKRVQEGISERQQQLNHLNSFITDNANIINLVRKLPDELNHDIMVPFGKAAFFPGRLVHTNEFKVLIGEGYYVDRTSKQTIDILNRRGKALGKQVESLKATMEDLKAQASFFDNTASEALEGIVEIVEEEDVEEGSPKPLLSTGSISSQSSQAVEEVNTKDTVGDDEYARIEAVFAELEKAEAAANSDDDVDEVEVEVDDEVEVEVDDDEELEEEEEEEEEEDEDEDEQIQKAVDYRLHQIRSPQVEASRLQEVTQGVPSHKNYPAPKTSMVVKPLEAQKVMNKAQSPLTASNTGIIGSIVEHDTGLYSGEQQNGAGNTKPLSRFKMQRK